MDRSENEFPHAFFLETFGLIHTDKRKFLYRLNHPQLSIPEQRLLKAFREFNRNDKSKSLGYLRTSPLASPFLEGVRLYLIGLVYNQHGHYRYAVENLEKSIKVLIESDDQRFILNPLCLLIVVHSNRREVQKMERWIRELRKIKPLSPLGQIQTQHCELLFAFMVGEDDHAEKILSQIVKTNDPVYRAFEPHLVLIHLQLYARQKRYEECAKLLKHYNTIAETAIVKANYSYIKTLLEHLHLGKPLYIYASKYKDFPELHQQLEVIKCLSTGNLEEAKKFWNSLRKHNPDLYHEDFKYPSDRSLFGQALEKYQRFSNQTYWDQAKIDQIPSKLDRLDFILSSAVAPLSPDVLIQLIWHEERDEKTHARLRKLISLYCKEKNVKVVSNQHSYALDRKSTD